MYVVLGQFRPVNTHKLLKVVSQLCLKQLSKWTTAWKIGRCKTAWKRRLKQLKSEEGK